MHKATSWLSPDVKRETETDRQRDTYRDRETERQRQRDRQRYTERQRERTLDKYRFVPNMSARHLTALSPASSTLGPQHRRAT